MQETLIEKLHKIIPHISENAITFPLWEEGDYFPALNFWQLLDSIEKQKIFFDRVSKFNSDSLAYEIINMSDEDEKIQVFSIQVIHEFNFEEEKYDHFKYSLEEMADIAYHIINGIDYYQNQNYLYSLG